MNLKYWEVDQIWFNGGTQPWEMETWCRLIRHLSSQHHTYNNNNNNTFQCNILNWNDLKATKEDPNADCQNMKSSLQSSDQSSQEIRPSAVMLRDVMLGLPLMMTSLILSWPLCLFYYSGSNVIELGRRWTYLYRIKVYQEHIFSFYFQQITSYLSMRKKNKISISHTLCALEPWQHLQRGVKPEYFVTILIIPRNWSRDRAEAGRSYTGIWSDPAKTGPQARIWRGREDWALDNEYC